MTAKQKKEIEEKSNKSVFIIGGTGLLGYHASKVFLEKGYKVSILALEKPQEKVFEEDVEYIVGDVALIPDNELVSELKKHDFLLIACGADDRITPKAPAIDFFRKHNVETIRSILRCAVLAKVKKVVVLGSYFTHFDREFPELELSKNHPYITSRFEQEQLALSENSSKMKVIVLELPYIFGLAPGKKPIWNVILDQINKHKNVFFTKGGTTMVTAHQVGQAIVGAFEFADGGAYLVAGKNLLWTEWLKIVLSALKQENRKIVIVPKWLVKVALKAKMNEDKKKGLESGLNMVKYVDFQTKCSFGDEKESQRLLHFEDDDLEAAIIESIKKCVE